ncbi:MAG: NADP-dependent isocitrate dehydrogenase [Pseudomonadota bacterium]
MLETLRSRFDPSEFSLEEQAPVDSDPGPTSLKTPVVFIPGDGIGPEVTRAARDVIDAAYPHIEWLDHEAGQSVPLADRSRGVPEKTLQAIADTGLVLKGPLGTPIGVGGKSANVTLRKNFELFANIRPVSELPGVPTRFSGAGIDMVIVRENVEDLYAGIEYMQTPDVAQCLKLISRLGSEKINRLAFELARAQGREKVTCATKANIMKMTEGLFKRVFEEAAADYPEIAANHQIIDNCAQQLVMAPEQFDVIVTTNMNGDILSDLAAGLVGGLGLAPSANIGQSVAMFEAVHGTAPDLAGRDIANPIALIRSGVMMLRHIGAFQAATSIEHALYATLESGRHLTPDIAGSGSAGTTRDFTAAVIDNLGLVSASVPERPVSAMRIPRARPSRAGSVARGFVGIDVFVEWDGHVDALADRLAKAIRRLPFRLELISNRGMQVFPQNHATTEMVNHWRCRFFHDGTVGRQKEQQAICALLEAINNVCTWMHVERLQRFDDRRAYSKAQGE